ncbi:LPS export ABC transporter periplasmic protein LptC [Hymenobacter mucosus]|uniref:LPS export ABC transporter protein LptC n=1 Tax=Hymenobacter mucosus TaxID=1411120 RepID=A0A238WTE9_9BACT|nr:LPS export ABC transporter periplasmic protein LptC [Hymenobacter mucosus]SNR49504.1 LPS export ABC transporter protein LptC [Hymenobacter mucosus]
MNTYGRHLLWISGLAVLLLDSCQKQADEVVKPVSYTGPLIETENVLMLVSDSAKLRIRLKAPLEQDFENGDQIFPKGLSLTFLSEDGSKVVNTIEANYGKKEKAKSLYIVRGNVRVSNVEKQQRMNTEEAFYDTGKALIYTKETTEVRVTTPTEVLTGKGLTANQDFSRYTILTPTGVFDVNSAPAPASSR